MKRLLILLLVFSSCKKEVFYYPSKTFFDEKNPTEIKIDDLEFKQITDSVRSGLYDKKHYFIRIEDNNNIYKLSPITYTFGLVRNRSSLKIEGDSIRISSDKFPLSDLSKYLKLYYENEGKDYLLPDSYKRTYVKLILEKDVSGKKLNDLLLNIVTAYNKAQIKNKDSISFTISLEYPIPTPKTKPPMPSSIEIID